MTRLPHVLCLSLGLAACVEDQGPVESYPFVGRWDCGVATFSFTNSTYNNGSRTYPISSVVRRDRSYLLTFADGYRITLAAVTDTGLTWISGATGDQFNCRRL
ncbi:hypothetical protein [Rhodobacter calidifons]|uniref:Membrane-bound lysozyme inhibitor of c-type lysozyme MliC n=1 Tax=Rhodobacter calidifons TaxID=2715277 RepID=A0ABX0G942_9RHOB|nr:hypothetical protein [Rhodobacter calidifons]NHB77400.1 hypothetical protein [Rhodobacter calidifons]